MSQTAIQLYDNLRHAANDDDKNRLIAEAFEELQSRYPDLEHVATKQNLSETELRLRKDIEGTRLEIKEVEANLRKDIEVTRLEIKEVEANLRKDIEGTRLEIKEVEANLQKDIRAVESSLIRWIASSFLAIAIGFSGLVVWIIDRLPVM
ncbi:MAG: DUF1640 domain-containing protein [Thiotrichales bacterium]|jgi:predicted nucleic acid-binding protein|nr:DUF1640 domain-containing protein [Thiotrichales bacterium]